MSKTSTFNLTLCLPPASRPSHRTACLWPKVFWEFSIEDCLLSINGSSTLEYGKCIFCESANCTTFLPKRLLAFWQAEGIWRIICQENVKKAYVARIHRIPQRCALGQGNKLRPCPTQKSGTLVILQMYIVFVQTMCEGFHGSKYTWTVPPKAICKTSPRNFGFFHKKPALEKHQRISLLQYSVFSMKVPTSICWEPCYLVKMINMNSNSYEFSLSL